MADGSEGTSHPIGSKPEPAAPSTDTIPEPVREVVMLYEERPELRFPDVDHEVLATRCEEVRLGASEVERAHAALDEARRAQTEREGALWACARRAFAYAQIYAEGEAELATELAAFQLARGTGSSSGKKARRTRKQKSPKKSTARGQEGELPFETESLDGSTAQSAPTDAS